jgi:hypothetical protein
VYESHADWHGEQIHGAIEAASRDTRGLRPPRPRNDSSLNFEREVYSSHRGRSASLRFTCQIRGGPPVTR